MPTSDDASSSTSSDAQPKFADVSPHDLVQVGFVFRPHGLEGELKIDPEHTDDPARFEELPTVFLGAQPHRVTRHAIVSVRYQQTKRGTTVILGVEGIDDRDDAEAVAKFKVFATEEALELEDGELFAHELIGWDVVAEDGTALGTVANLMQMPGQDMLVVRGPENEEMMIPVVEDFIVGLDDDEGCITVRLIEGLMGE
ncbi:MAG: 16S rRNA processing protein RimM [Bacteroidetes bacterium SW_11_64_17]|nr:MAG: 16S rRNA processing protein RimM [Bacteroidetes bacterium SW_11_64_17]